MSAASPLELRQFLVKEHVGMLKLTDTFDIFDPQTQAKVAVAQETPGAFIKILRLIINKKALPTAVQITQGSEPGGPLLFSIRKPMTLFRSKVKVLDAQGTEAGYFKSKILSLGGGFWVYDVKDQQVAEVKGDWKGWNFQFLSPGGKALGSVTKKWAGIAKEMFTSADTYMVSIEEEAARSPLSRILLLAAALAIDLVYKEN